MSRKCVSLGLPLLVLLAAGCSSKGTIMGTVTYKGAPIPEGSVQFMPENGGPTVSAVINDGKYTAEKVPVGPAKVAIASLVPSQQDNAMTKMMMSGGKGGGPPPDAKIPEEARKLFSGGGAAPKKGLKIPDKYSDLQNPVLTHTVTGGKQTRDFNLE